MKKNHLIGILGMALMVACAKQAGNSNPISAEEAELRDQQKFAEEYKDVEVGHMYYYGTKDTVIPLLEHGTGVLYLGFPECPWCQAYVPMLNEAAVQTNTQIMYYNVYIDKTEDMDFYQKVAELINEKNAEIIQYDNDGNMRIYMPLVLFLKSGELVGYDNETCMEDSQQIQPSEYWSDDKITSLKNKLLSLCSDVRKAQEENDNRGCDTGCEVEEPEELDMGEIESLLSQAYNDIHPGVAGSSITISTTAAEMMSWYTKYKPSAETIRSIMDAFVEDKGSDKGTLSFVFESLQGASSYALSDEGKAELSNNGFMGDIDWTEDDVNQMFMPILEAINAIP